MVQVSNKWKYTVKIKDQFVDDSDDVTPELTTTLCISLATQLNKIKESVEKSNLVEDDKYTVVGSLEECIDHFEFLRDLSNGTIPEEEWDDYSFDGNFVSMFNDYMNELYDLGDVRVTTTNGVSEKFLWID